MYLCESAYICRTDKPTCADLDRLIPRDREKHAKGGNAGRTYIMQWMCRVVRQATSTCS